MMLRQISGRCVRVTLALSSDLRVAHHGFAHNLTSCQILKPMFATFKMTMSSKSDRENLKSKERESGNIIYRGKLERDIIRVKLFSMTTSIMGLAFQPILFKSASSVPVLIATCSVAGFFTFVTPVLLHLLAKRYVNRMTYHKEKDNYIAHTTTFFFREKKIPIQPGEAKVPAVGGMFTALEVRGIPLMVEMDGFEKRHLVRLLGYDQPLDIEHDRIASYKKQDENDHSSASACNETNQSDEKSEKQRSSSRL